MDGCRSISRVALTALLVSLSFGPCNGGAEEPAQPRRPQGRLQPGPVVRTEVTGCLETVTVGTSTGDLPPCPGIILLARGNAVTMYHFDATLNCCTDIAVAANVQNGLLRFRELESGNLCACLCSYQLTAEAAGLEAGPYSVGVEASNGAPLCRRQVVLPAASPEVAFTHSACVEPENDASPESVTFSVSGRTLQVEHRNALLNCCMDLDVEVESGPSWLRLREVDRAPACNCLCKYGIFLVVPELEAGITFVELVGVDGQVVGTLNLEEP